MTKLVVGRLKILTQDRQTIEMLTFSEAMLKMGGNLKRDSTAVISSWLLLDMEGVLHMKASRLQMLGHEVVHAQGKYVFHALDME